MIASRLSGQQWAILICLLLLQFTLRTHNLEGQSAFLDEGYHLLYAERVYRTPLTQLDHADGKLMLYYWVGLFLLDDPATMLFIGRAAVAILTLVTGAAMVRIGGSIGGFVGGVLALALYAIMPMAVFYDRMVLSDALASAFVTLAFWRGLCWVTTPTRKNSIAFGAMIFGAVFAKLTVAPVISLPLVLVLIMRDKRRIWAYLRPIFIVGLTVLMLASPFVLGIAIGSLQADDAGFINGSLIQLMLLPQQIGTHMQLIATVIDDFYVRVALISIGLVGLVNLWVAPRQQAALFLWLGSVVAVPLLLIDITASRYYAPIVPPLILTVVLGLITWQRWSRYLLMIVVSVWIVLFAMPFVTQTLTDPQGIAFDASNHALYQRGIYNADDQIRRAAQLLNQTHTDEPIFAAWFTCYLIFYTVDAPVTCLDRFEPRADLQQHIAQLEPDEKALLVLSLSRPIHENNPNMGHQVLMRITRDNIANTIDIIHVWRTEDTP